VLRLTEASRKLIKKKKERRGSPEPAPASSSQAFTLEDFPHRRRVRLDKGTVGLGIRLYDRAGPDGTPGMCVAYRTPHHIPLRPPLWPCGDGGRLWV